MDVTIVSGRFPFRRPEPPFLAGYSGVGALPDGQRVYFENPTAPYCTLAELAPVDQAAVVPLPAGIDDAIAAALGLSGLAAWLALDWRAPLTAGETALVLGAGGAVGQAAAQVAKILGAGRVVAADRSDAGLTRARERGADATAQLTPDEDLRAALRAAAPDGYDVVSAAAISSSRPRRSDGRSPAWRSMPAMGR